MFDSTVQTKEERKKLIQEIEELEAEINRWTENIAGKEKLADNDWRLYKQTGDRKYFFRANTKYKEWNKMKAQLCELEKEKEFLKNKWNLLKKVAQPINGKTARQYMEKPDKPARNIHV